MDGDLAAVVHTVKNDAVAVFQNGLGEEHLAAAEHVAVARTQKLDADALVFIGVIEGTAHRGAVGIVVGLTTGIVDKEAGHVGIEAAVDEHVVAAIIDAAVKAGTAEDVGEFVVLAEMGDIDAGAAVPDMAVGHVQCRTGAVTGVLAGDAAAGEAVDIDAGNGGVAGVDLGNLRIRVTEEQEAVAVTHRFGQLDLLLRAHDGQVTDSAVGTQPDGKFAGITQQKPGGGSLTPEHGVVGHRQVFYHKGAGAQDANAELLKKGFDLPRAVSGIPGAFQIVFHKESSFGWDFGSI